MLTADPSPPVPRRPSLIVTSEDDDASDADSFYSAEDSGEPPWWTRTERATASSSSTQKKNEALGLEEAFESVFRDETGEGPEPIAELFTPDATESPLEEPARNHVATPEPSAERKEVVDQPGTRQFSESDSDEEILNERNGNADAEGTEEIEELLSPAETERLLKESQELKESGNQFFALGRFGDALDDYKNALAKCPKSCRKERAVYHANAAACHMKLEQWKEAVKACGLALEDDPNYTKALLRRAQANEKLDTSTSLSAALEDYKTLLSLEPSNKSYAQSTRSLPAKINQRIESEKQEAMGKLKDLGNSFLGMFGLSTDNFEMVKGEGGGYSVKFNQNAGKK